MRANKFIVIEQHNGEREFRAGYVLYHMDLLNKNERDSQVVGGGMFSFDHFDKTITLFGKSQDYGSIHPEEMDELIKYKDDIIKFNLSFISESLDDVVDLSEYTIINNL